MIAVLKDSRCSFPSGRCARSPDSIGAAHLVNGVAVAETRMAPLATHALPYGPAIAPIG